MHTVKFIQVLLSNTQNTGYRPCSFTGAASIGFEIAPTHFKARWCEPKNHIDSQIAIEVAI
jgi:hypothetical protein